MCLKYNIVIHKKKNTAPFETRLITGVTSEIVAYPTQIYILLSDMVESRKFMLISSTIQT